MASRIPAFTSGIRPPSTASSISTLAKRRGPEMLTSQPTEKRLRATDDNSSKLLVIMIDFLKSTR